jgi:hypothetical protein
MQQRPVSSSRDTTCPALSSSAASMVRCFPAGNGTTTSPRRIMSGPSRQNSISADIGHFTTRNKDLSPRADHMLTAC